ncbi:MULTISPECIES: LysR substrate-binding domain-containing protein [Paraburkholderia]|uniref:LysR substrate-binding domain-containing protein n=1 Tax=Paraburkholderia TaxID=1822464 RepID=UPI0013A69D77|nr:MULTISPECIES: LysR substrate-binding domain-containing protein [Paraburkholderia]MDH6151175.1 DNA-binding transcriptional LysR family regulator [Paraburkholderia sp. WSM4179]
MPCNRRAHSTIAGAIRPICWKPGVSAIIAAATVIIAMTSVTELPGRERGRLRFAATPSIAAAIVPKLLAEYRALYPNIEVSVDDAAPDRLSASTLTGDVEFGIGTISERPEGITLQCLARDNLCAICRKDSELAKKRRVSWKDALQSPWIGIKSTSGIRKLIDETLFTHGMRKAVEYEVSYMTTGLSMVQAGLSCTRPVVLYEYTVS